MITRLELPIAIVIVLLLLVSGQKTNGSATRTCPSYCTCDLFKNFNRADCSGQRLILPNVEVPTAVELLDLSYNDITTLDNACFEGLIYVVNLTIAYNALHTIYLDAFSPLKNVNAIDISFNRLEYFDKRIFEANTNLTSLNLSGNKFMSLQNMPLLRSTSIQYLALNDAQIAYIYPLMFIEMPALRELDASSNFMITISASSFDSLHQLKSVNLEENRLICDKSLHATLQLLKKRGVEVELSLCMFNELANGSPPKFERMMDASSQQTAPRRESTSVENVWKPNKPTDDELEDAATCEQQSIAKICLLHRTCLISNRMLTKEKLSGEFRRHGQYTANDLSFAFMTGITLGIVVVSCLVGCAMCIKCCCASHKKITQRRRDGTRVVNTTPFRRPIPPPIPARQRRSNRRSANPPQLNRSLSSPARRGPPPGSNQGDFATFLSRLFERPSGNRYYRTINENTGHLIRRLSQSNLFNNRRSQNLSGTRDSENAQQVEPLICTQAAESRPSSSQPQVHRSPENRWQVVRVNVASAPPARPETPPPAYGDVISHKGLV